jgi:hypothetical protein
MRHEQLRLKDSFDTVDAAAIWRAGNAGSAGPLAEIEAGLSGRAAAAVPDMPVAIGRAIVTLYAALITIFFVTMGFSGEARFMIVISGLYVAMFFAVPRIMLEVEGGEGRPTMRQFMAAGVDTYTGRLSGAAALAQIFAVPALIALAVLAIGTVALFTL